jgi:hypothetical protein
MRPLFKIMVAVHSILLILDVSGAHPIASLSLFYRSSNAHQTLGWALCGSLLFLSISLGRSSIAHLSLIFRSSISLQLVLIIIESLQTRWMAPPDGSAVQALCLATFRHSRLHSSQFAFASAGIAALLGQRTVSKIVDVWVQVVLFAFDSVSFWTLQTLSKSPRRWNTIDWQPVCDWFMGLIAGPLSSISSCWAIAWQFAV